MQCQYVPCALKWTDLAFSLMLVWVSPTPPLCSWSHFLLTLSMKQHIFPPVCLLAVLVSTISHTFSLSLSWLSTYRQCNVVILSTTESDFILFRTCSVFVGTVSQCGPQDSTHSAQPGSVLDFPVYFDNWDLDWTVRPKPGTDWICAKFTADCY